MNALCRSKIVLAQLCWGMLLSTPLVAQNNADTLEGLNEALLNEPSGWLRVEVAVVIDASESALFSEQWPLSPEPRYPQRARWLIDPAADEELMSQYPTGELRTDERGAQTIVLPTPEQLIAEANAEMAAVMARYLDDLSAAILPDMPDLSLPIASYAASADSAASERSATGIRDSVPSPLPLEAWAEQKRPLDDLQPLALDELRAGVMALEDVPPRVMPTSTTEPHNDSEAQQDDALTAEPPPALPTAFVKQEGSLLAQGLQRLSRRTGEQVRMYGAWLQPPDATHLPIVLTDSVDDSDWPALQGFVQMVERDGWRIGVNIWLNTQGDYLPDGLTLPAPPAQPNRRVFISEDSQEILAGDELLQRQQWLQAFHQTQLRGDFPPAPDVVDPYSDVFTTAGADSLEDADSLEAATPEPLSANDESIWPYRHVIHVADTRSLLDGNVRYFDHPVIKILATYTELSWGEVYALGDKEQALREQPEVISP